jgi:acyl transferase domain-containing protein
MTIRTGCSASLIGLNEACMAIARGDCKAAIVGGTNILLAPNLTVTMSETGVISRDSSCKTFSANADGYGRGEAVASFFVKPLDAAIRDGNPIRAVLAGSAANHDGKTNGLTLPSAEAQEALIRRAYEVGGIKDPSRLVLKPRNQYMTLSTIGRSSRADVDNLHQRLSPCHAAKRHPCLHVWFY